MTDQSIEYAREVLKREFGVEGKLTPLGSEWGGTFRVQSDRDYLLKIAPDHMDVDRILLEVEVLEHLHRSGVKPWVPQRVPPRTAKPELERVRLYRWIEGESLRNINPHTPALLGSIGSKLGALKKGLEDFEHPGASFYFEWAPTNWRWVKDALHLFEGEDLRMMLSCVERLEGIPLSKYQEGIPMAINYGDANDDNTIIRRTEHGPEFSGFIDFGDLYEGPAINDLATCLAYVMLRKSDPVASACQVIKGYQEVFQISERELEVLFPLSMARLMISVTKARQRAARDPDNAYWQVSAKDAWRLLGKLSQYPEHLALCQFRATCGLVPSPKAHRITRWLIQNFKQIHPILGFDLTNEKVTLFDWSVSSKTLGDFEAMADIEQLTRDVFARMSAENTRVGIGRYNEPRPVYTTSEYAIPANDGHYMRTVHIGIDLFIPAGTPLYAPLDGVVHTIVNDVGDKEYGPLLILKHEVNDELTFYTLYGHNHLGTLDMWNRGDSVQKGQKIAEIGPFPENGNWVPHVHFQVLTDMLDYTDDFPGVVVPEHQDVWLSICPDPNLMLGIRHPELTYQRTSSAELQSARSSVIGPNLSISYSQPLHIVRGWKTCLYDEEGRSYLDTRNNIAHVGHEHPRLSRVAASQISLLNTNTRYLHKARIACAAKLLDSLPRNLKYVYFVNSGSEANDLALRMARAATGQDIVATLDQAYHGHTQAVLDVSPYKFNGKGGSGCPANTLVLPTPDPYRMRLYDSKAVDSNLASNAISTLNDGLKAGSPVIFIHESLPSCAGQIVPPSGYFRTLYSAVRERNGICIADEVQTGMGRVGNAMWSFQLYGIEPDIVTIGKPLGNGHPVAAVVVSEPVASAFDNGMEYFNSFGGNPVSCAIALEVMQILEDEGLQQHALLLGTEWMDALREMQQQYPVIGDVRGHGLFIGIEFTDPATADPASRKTSYVVERMLDHRILTSRDGPDENILKIKPPMSITADEVALFNRVLRKILEEDAMR